MKTFNFYKDEKVTMWFRGKFEIEAESLEEAKQKVIKLEDSGDWNEIDVYWQPLDETIESMSVEENDNQSTVEIFVDSLYLDSFYENKKTT